MVTAIPTRAKMASPSDPSAVVAAVAAVAAVAVVAAGAAAAVAAEAAVAAVAAVTPVVLGTMAIANAAHSRSGMVCFFLSRWGLLVLQKLQGAWCHARNG